MGEAISINAVILRFVKFAEKEYVRDGRPTDELYGLRAALRRLRRAFDNTPAAEFGPRSLKLLRQDLIDTGLSRKYINDTVNRIRRVFRWATSEELSPVSVHLALKAVPGLRRGRSAAREPQPVVPVAWEVVEATLPQVLPPIAAMGEIQYLAGTRPDEICSLRPCDLSITDDGLGIYRPASHKTQHLGRERWIVLGPQALEVLNPWLDRDPTSYCFCPAEAVRIFHAKRRTRCFLPRKPGQRYRTESYRTAIQRACRRNRIPVWSPNQLRHARATMIRQNCAPDAVAPGKPAKRDFVGWTGIVPILYFIEYRIGLKPDAPNNRLTWVLTTDERCGCERFRFGGHTVTLVAKPGDVKPESVHLAVESDGPFALRVERKGRQWDFAVEKGKNEFVLK